MERGREAGPSDREQAVMRLKVGGVEHPSVASYARGLQKEAWLMVAVGAVVANSTRHWMAKMVRDGDAEDVDHSGALHGSADPCGSQRFRQS